MGELPTSAGRVAIVAARFNHHIVQRLVDGAVETLQQNGVDASMYDIAWVPGAYELPQLAETMATTGRYDAIVALGAVVRGGTPHFDHVAGPCAQGLMHVSLVHGIPVAMGVLTTDDEQQALDRAGGPQGHKGRDAALTALQMIHACQQAAGQPESQSR